ncbi:MAG: HAD-IIA family hydrolase, partial [Anaerolineae bacterium]|nr:HAD-IIA family hydrolase [Anaerolineae bacterium]
IVDMDGVLWHAHVALPGIQDFFVFLRKQGIDFTLATNNSSRTPEHYAEKLARFGVDIPPEKILNSSEATAVYLSTIAPPGTRVYAVGEDGLRRALEKHGFTLSEVDASYVVVGWNRDLHWKHLATASLLIHNGAHFIGTNPDTSFPTERGPVPGNGAQLAAIEVTTGVKPIVIGKPAPGMYLEALRRMNASPDTTAVVGDRLDTDILGGIRTNLTGILVLSGITTREAAAESEIKPNLVCTDIRDLVRMWTEQLGKSTGKEESEL